MLEANDVDLTDTGVSEVSVHRCLGGRPLGFGSAWDLVAERVLKCESLTTFFRLMKNCTVVECH